MLGADETRAVVAVLIDMELMRDTMLMQSGSVELRMFNGDHFVRHCVPEEARRQAGTNLELTRCLANEFLAWLLSDEHAARGSVWLGCHADDGIT